MRTSLAALAVVVMLCGCAFKQTVYNTLKTTTKTATTAHAAWGDYVEAGMASVDDQHRVNQAVREYNRALDMALFAIMAYKKGETTEEDMDNAVLGAVAASKAMDEIIHEIRKSL